MLGDVAVFSLGPGKQIDAGEGGVLLLADCELYRAAVQACCHPVRQLLSGVDTVDTGRFSMRPHPAAAVLAAYELARWSRQRGQVMAAQARQLLAGAGVIGVGDDPRRTTARPSVPVLVEPHGNPQPPAGIVWARTGARALAYRDAPQLAELLTRVRLTTLAPTAVSTTRTPPPGPGSRDLRT